jgi:prevent-host-death family protein
MKSMLISDFKTHCVAAINSVKDYGEEILVTRRGRPLARVVPADAPKAGKRQPGDARDQAQIIGEIEHDQSAGDWEALRD